MKYRPSLPARKKKYEIFSRKKLGNRGNCTIIKVRKEEGETFDKQGCIWEKKEGCHVLFAREDIGL